MGSEWVKVVFDAFCLTHFCTPKPMFYPLLHQFQDTVTTQTKLKLIPPKYDVAFAFVLIFIGTDDLSLSSSHRYFAPNLTFTFAFVILKAINSDIILP